MCKPNEILGRPSPIYAIRIYQRHTRQTDTQTDERHSLAISRHCPMATD